LSVDKVGKCEERVKCLAYIYTLNNKIQNTYVTHDEYTQFSVMN